MPSPDAKRGSRSERKRAQIRVAAYRSFRDFGYHETSVDSICRAASISKGSFYWHYDSKQEVFVDILETWTREVMDEVIQQFEAALETDDPARALASAFAREIHRGRAIVPLWLEFTVLARREPEIQRALSRFYRRARAAIAEMMRPLVRGELTEDQIRASAAVIFGAYAGIVMQDLADPNWVDAAQVADHFMSVLDRALFGPRAAALASSNAAAPPPPTEGERAEPRDIEALIAAVDPDTAEHVAQLRELVLATLPEANERVIAGWRVIAYDRGGLLAYIKPTRDAEVHLGFYRGAELDDSDLRLEGSGKLQRHVRLPLDQPLDSAPLQALLRLAASLQGDPDSTPSPRSPRRASARRSGSR